MAGRHTNTHAARPPARLYLVGQLPGDAAALTGELAGLLRMADIAAVLVKTEPAPDQDLVERVKRLAQPVQAEKVALLIADRADIVVPAGADGAHLTGVDALKTALPGLKPDRIAGVGGLRTRHDAMLAGEAGADYVMFGEPGAGGARPPFQAIIECVTWWAELFEIPCVAYAANLDEIAPLYGAGADFIALGEGVFSDPRGPAAALREASERLSESEAVA